MCRMERRSRQVDKGWNVLVDLDVDRSWRWQQVEQQGRRERERLKRMREQSWSRLARGILVFVSAARSVKRRNKGLCVVLGHVLSPGSLAVDEKRHVCILRLDWAHLDRLRGSRSGPIIRCFRRRIAFFVTRRLYKLHHELCSLSKI